MSCFCRRPGRDREPDRGARPASWCHPASRYRPAEPARTRPRSCRQAPGTAPPDSAPRHPAAQQTRRGRIPPPRAGQRAAALDQFRHAAPAQGPQRRIDRQRPSTARGFRGEGERVARLRSWQALGVPGQRRAKRSLTTNNGETAGHVEPFTGIRRPRAGERPGHARRRQLVDRVLVDVHMIVAARGRNAAGAPDRAAAPGGQGRQGAAPGHRPLFLSTTS